MTISGVNDVNLFGILLRTAIIKSKRFSDDLSYSIDKNFQLSEDDFNTYSILMVDQRQITELPGEKNNIKEFFQWLRDDTRVVCNTGSLSFPVAHALTLTRRYKSQKMFIKNIIRLQVKPSLQSLLLEIGDRNGHLHLRAPSTFSWGRADSTQAM